MRELREELGTAIMMITHDLGVIAELVEKVVVMYTGRIVEAADTYTIFKNPKHPYTIGLLASIPRLDSDGSRLKAIPGTVPTPGNFPEGCGFHPRCAFARELCARKRPPSFDLGNDHHVACWRLVDYDENADIDQKEVG